MDVPRSKPPRVADPPKPRTVNRFCSSRTTSECTPPIRTTATRSPKLEELKLAFCLLAREIQGSDGDENDSGASTYTPATTNAPGGGGKGGERVSEPSRTGTDFAAAAPPEVTEPAPTTPTQAAVAATAAVGAVAVQLSVPYSSLLPGGPEASVPSDKVTGTVNATSSVAVYPETENPLATTKAPLVSHHCRDTGNLERVQAASRALGHTNATKDTARGAKQALKRLQAELEAERRSRTAAERWVVCRGNEFVSWDGHHVIETSCACIIHDGVATCLSPARVSFIVVEWQPAASLSQYMFIYLKHHTPRHWHTQVCRDHAKAATCVPVVPHSLRCVCLSHR